MLSQDRAKAGVVKIPRPQHPDPEPVTAKSMIGQTIPVFAKIRFIEFDETTSENKPLLICFWDMNQRPSRRCVRELAKQSSKLADKGIVVVGIHASSVEENTLNDWLAENEIPFPVGMITGDVQKTLFNWGVRAQPWLILTDKAHIVQAEGFGLTELGKRIKAIVEK